MTLEERKALVKSYLGKIVDIKIDRPIGYIHKKEKYDLVYNINYGYIPNVLGGDGEELDVYLMGIDEPLCEYTCRIIGIVYRENDVEDKLIAAPVDKVFYQNDIKEAINFQEKYYQTRIESLYEKSCGTILFTLKKGVAHYLLLCSKDDNYCSLPKGHMEVGESEKETALRETWEETSIKARIYEEFRVEHSYPLSSKKKKDVVYFLASFENQTPRHNPGFEYKKYLLVPFDEAYELISFKDTKDFLKLADEYITINILGKKSEI